MQNKIAHNKICLGLEMQKSFSFLWKFTLPEVSFCIVYLFTWSKIDLSRIALKKYGINKSGVNTVNSIVLSKH